MKVELSSLDNFVLQMRPSTLALVEKTSQSKKNGKVLLIEELPMKYNVPLT